MTPKDILSPRNILGAFLIGIVMAALIFVGTQVFVWATVSDVVITNISAGKDGVKSVTPGEQLGVFKLYFEDAEDNEGLQSIKLRISEPGAPGGRFTASSPGPLADITPGSVQSGLIIVKDANGNQKFDPALDMIIPTSVSQFTDNGNDTFDYTLALSAPFNNIPINDGDYFFLVATMDKLDIVNNEDITISVVSPGGILTNGVTTPNPTFSGGNSEHLQMKNANPTISKAVVNGDMSQAGTTIDIIFSEGMTPVADPIGDVITCKDMAQNAHSLGSGAAYQFVQTGAGNDTLRVTIGTGSELLPGDSCTIAALTSAATSNALIEMGRTVMLDTFNPQLRSVTLVQDAGSDGQATQQGDTLQFIFNEPIAQGSITSGNLDALLNPSVGDLENGTPALINFINATTLNVTLIGGGHVNTVGANFDPSDNVKDQNKNKDKTQAPGPVAVAPITTYNYTPSNVVLADTDQTEGISAADINISWTNTGGAETIDHLNVYIMPNITSDIFARPAVQPVNPSPLAKDTTSFTGAQMAELKDSTGSNLMSGTYVAYVVGSTAASGSETWQNSVVLASFSSPISNDQVQAPPPQAPTGTYAAVNPGLGNNSVISLGMGAPGLEGGGNGQIACPGGMPENTVCYDKTGVVLNNPGAWTGGIAANNIAAIARADTLGGNSNELWMIFDQGNVIQTVGEAQVTLPAGFAGVIAGNTTYNLQLPPAPPQSNCILIDQNAPPACSQITVEAACNDETGGLCNWTTECEQKGEAGFVCGDATTAAACMQTTCAWTGEGVPPSKTQGDILYTASNPTYNNKSTLQANFNSILATDVATVDCPEGFAEQTVCYNIAGVTASSGITGNVSVLVVPDPAKKYQLFVVYDQADAIADIQNASITINNIGGVTNPITSTKFTAAGGAPPASSCTLYKDTPNCTMITNQSDCTDNTSGICEWTSSCVDKNAPADNLVCSNIANAPACMSTTCIWTAEGAAPSKVLGGISYMAVNPGVANNSTLTFALNTVADTTDGNVSCPGGVPGGVVCFNTSGITASSGITGNVVAIFQSADVAKKYEMNVVYDAPNVIADTQSASITFNGFAGIASPMEITSFTAPQPQGGGLSVLYVNAFNGNDNKTIFLVDFGDTALTTDNQVTCPTIQNVAFPQGAICYNTAGVTELTGSGIANGIDNTNVTAIVRGEVYDGVDNTAVIVYLDIADVVTDDQNASATFNNFGGITNPMVISSFSALGGGGGSSTEYINADNTYNNGNSLLIIDAGETLTSDGSITCPTIQDVTFPDSSTCYNTAGITSLSGNGLKAGVNTSSIIALAKSENYGGYDGAYLVAYLNTNNVIEDDKDVTVIVNNNFGGIQDEIESTDFSESNGFGGGGGGDPVVSYYNYDPNLNNNKAMFVLVSPSSFTTDGQVACPTLDGVAIPGGAVCYAEAGVTNLSGDGLKAGVDASNVDAIIRADAFESSDKNIVILFDQAGIIENKDSVSITINGFGGVAEPATVTAFQQAEDDGDPPGAAPTSLKGFIKYVAKNESQNFGNSTFLVTFNENLSEAGAAACPTGLVPDGATCYDLAGVQSLDGWALGGITKNDIVTMVRGDAYGLSAKDVLILFNASNILSELEGVFIEFDGFGGISGSIMGMEFSDIKSITCNDSVGVCNIDNGGVISDYLKGNGQHIDGPNYNITFDFEFTEKKEIEQVVIEHMGGTPDNYMKRGEIQYYDDVSEEWSLLTTILNDNENDIVTVNSFDPIETKKLRVICKENVNIAGGWQPTKFRFSTAEAGEEYWNMTSDEHVFPEVMSPGPFSTVSDSLEQIYIAYSGPLLSDGTENSVTGAGNVVVKKGGGQTVDITPSFNSDVNALVIDINESLSGESSISVTTKNIQAANGQSIWEEQFTYYLSGSSPTTPSVQARSIPPNATGVSTSQSEILLQFNEFLSIPASGSGVTISPSLNASYTYDPRDSVIRITPRETLKANTEYTISYAATADTDGNKLQGLFGDDIASGSLTFTTGDTDNTAPKIEWADIHDNQIKVGFNIPMKDSVTSTGNWSITCDGQDPGVTFSSINYIKEENFVEIFFAEDMSGASQYSNCTLSVQKAIVTGLNGVSFGSGDNEITQGGIAEEIDYGFTAGEEDWMMGMCMDANCTEADKWSDPMIMGWSPIMFEPSTKVSSIAAAETFIGIPLMQSIQTGDLIVIDLPTGSSMDQGSMEILSDDLNGPGGAMYNNTYYYDALIKVTDTSYNTATRKLTLTIGIDADGDGSNDSGAKTDSGDYLDFVLKGFVNGDATQYEYSTGNGGAYASFSTKRPTGQYIEENIGYSTPYTVEEGGSGTISGKVVESGTSTGVSGVKVMCESPNTGFMTTTTAGDGTYSFSSLPNGEYFVFPEPDKSSAGYIVVASTDSIVLDNSNTSESSVNFKVKQGTKTATITISHNGVGADGQTKAFVDAFESENNMFTGKEITLDADGETSTTLSLSPGEWKISMEYFKEFDFMDDHMGDMSMGQDFLIPKGETIVITEASSNITAEIRLSSADAKISGKVTDRTGNGVASAEVYVYRHDGMSGDKHTQTDGSGRYELDVAGDSSYTIGAFLPGAPGYVEQNIHVEFEETISDYSLIIDVPSIIIQGTVTGGLQDVWIDAFNEQTGEYFGTQADSNTGKYSIRVNQNSTYKIKAYSEKGELQASGDYADNGANIVEVVTSNISGANFSYDSSSFGNISGTLTGAIGGETVCAESYNPSSVDKEPMGKWACANVDTGGNFTISTKKNARNGEKYRLMAFTSTYGSLPEVEDIDISTSDASGINISPGTTYQVTLDITGIPSSATELFFDAFNPTNFNGMGFDIRAFSEGTATRTFNLPEGTYDTFLYIPGLGDFAPDTGDYRVSITEDTTLTYTLGNVSSDFQEITITVKDKNGDVVRNAWVEAFEPQTGVFSGTFTDNSGVATLNMKISNSIILRADHSDYTNVKQTLTKASLEENSNVTLGLGAEKTSSVSFSIPNAQGNVWIDLVGTINGHEFWAGGETNDQGALTLNVPDGISGLTAYMWAENGKSYAIGATNNSIILGFFGLGDIIAFGGNDGISSGDSVEVNFNNFNAAENHMEDLLKAPDGSDIEPATTTYDAASGIEFDDSANSGVTIKTDPYSIASESQSCSTSIETVANLPQSETLSAKGIIGKEVKFTCGGSLVTDVAGDYEFGMTLTKSQIEDSKGQSFNSFQALDTMSLGYWDSSTNTYQTESTTRRAYVKPTEGDSWESVAISTLTDNIDANSSYYYDWKLELEATVNHATIFSPITGSDSTPPAGPTGLSATALSSTTILLDWNDNGESDMLEYEVYKHTASPVPFGQVENEAYQINTSAVTSSIFTDTSITTDGTYCYAITAVDDSGNESATADEACVTISSGSEDTTTTTGGGTPMVGGSSGDGDDEETTEDTTEEETTEEETTTEDDNVMVGGEEEVATEEGCEDSSDYGSHWGAEFIVKVIEAGIAQGTGECEFSPDRAITRAELTKMVIKAFGYEIDEDFEGDPSFTDVALTEWYAPYVEKAYELGIIEGYDDETFDPGAEINRAEAMKILVGAYFIGKDDSVLLAYNYIDDSPFEDAPTGQWYSSYVMYAYYEGVIGGYADGTFGPGNSMTRAEFSKVIANIAGL